MNTYIPTHTKSKVNFTLISKMIQHTILINPTPTLLMFKTQLLPNLNHYQTITTIVTIITIIIGITLNLKIYNLAQLQLWWLV